ncbi:hypothetical protein I5G63_gp028 [Mycobacterium phage Imvubu]|uniref:Uncharacterized protein n=1 Tax=Mycobacterium phage Imvubu TaxID=2686233 RepID=A0A6B9LK01_9CAUD|nr:hypothetical protein I5G63_gp028 [Mycobacterium phage Imvubu]QHB37769.1 hypothetical protein PBI_IMVUBU_28 [Mycobacterium phage Imvubu]
MTQPPDTTAPEDDGYVYAVGFEVADIPGETLPPQPQEPLPPSPDAGTAEQAAYADAVAAHLEAMRVYNGNIAAMLASEAYWRYVRTEMPTREAAEAQVREVLAVHTANPLVRNIGLDRVERPEWERVALTPTT